jgi:hypothetical protein
MHILQIEHQVGDYDLWKRNAFDADPLGRAHSGVRHHRISRSTDDPNHVFIDLEFSSRPQAEAMHVALKNLWRSPLAKITNPTARIIESVEAKDY